MSDEKVISFELVPTDAKYVSRAAEVLVESRLARYAKVIRFSYPQDASISRVEMSLAGGISASNVQTAILSLTNTLKDYGISLVYKSLDSDKYDVVEEIKEAIRYIAEGDVDYGSEILTFISEANIDTSVQFELGSKKVQLTVSEAAGAILDAIREVTAGIRIQ
jgi:hypothetical protein